MNKNSYNQIALKWATIRNNSFVSKLVIDFAEKTIPRGSILDIGCGTGYPLAKYLCDKNKHVTGIDFSEKMIEIARSQKLSNADFEVCDFFDFVSKTKFDGVLAWDSLWHFPKEKQKSVFSKVGNLLNPEGYFLFTHGCSDEEHIDQMMGNSFYYSSLSLDKVNNCLNKAGFEIEYCLQNFVEKDTDRDLVILAKKRNNL